MTFLEKCDTVKASQAERPTVRGIVPRRTRL
nr:MAG TPA: hypothetical protein [Caudoviricetes sp.]